MVDITDELDLDDLDYLHPNGKPRSAFIGPLDAKPTAKELRLAMDEADGHYMPRFDPWLHDTEDEAY